jgi:hypothetical protein
MKPANRTALRAHLVLLCLSICIAGTPSLGLSVAWGLFDDDAPFFPQLSATLALVVLIMAGLRWAARRAFNSALDARHIELLDETGDEASIDDHCARPWLVQLHLELQGRHCVD